MRVRIAYNIDFDDVMVTIEELLSRADREFNMTVAKSKEIEKNLEMDNCQLAIELLADNKARLSKVVDLYEDCHSILVGYQQVRLGKHQLSPELDMPPPGETPLEYSSLDPGVAHE